jgi:DNA polymerase-3 subunit alpha
MLGLYISGHPLDEFADQIKELVTVFSYDFEIPEEGQAAESRMNDGQFVRIAGIIADIKTISTKSNKMMAFVTIEDLYGQMEVIVFPNIFEQNARFLTNDSQIIVEGRISVKEDEQPKILADKIRQLERKPEYLATAEAKKTVEIKKTDEPNVLGNNAVYEEQEGYRPTYSANPAVMNEKSDAGKIIKILFDENVPENKRKAGLALLHNFEGQDRALVYIDKANKPQIKLNIHINEQLVNELKNIVGPNRVKVSGV